MPVLFGTILAVGSCESGGHEGRAKLGRLRGGRVRLGETARRTNWSDISPGMAIMES